MVPFYSFILLYQALDFVPSWGLFRPMGEALVAAELAACIVAVHGGPASSLELVQRCIPYHVTRPSASERIGVFLAVCAATAVHLSALEEQVRPVLADLARHGPDAGAKSVFLQLIAILCPSVVDASLAEVFEASACPLLQECARAALLS